MQLAMFVLALIAYFTFFLFRKPLILIIILQEKPHPHLLKDPSASTIIVLKASMMEKISVDLKRGNLSPLILQTHHQEDSDDPLHPFLLQVQRNQVNLILQVQQSQMFKLLRKV